MISSLTIDGQKLSIFWQEDAKNKGAELCSFSSIGNFSNTDIVIPDYIADNVPVTKINPTFRGPKCKSLTIPDSVRTICEGAFYASPVEKVIWPRCCIEIPFQCFIGAHIKEIVLPDTLTSIENQAFCNCKELKSIEIPDNVITIGDSAFEGCEQLSKVVWSNICKRIPPKCFKGAAVTNIENVQDVCFISEQAFSHSKVNGIDQFVNLRVIEDLAFCGANLGETLTLPKSCFHIGKSSFSLTKIKDAYLTAPSVRLYWQTHPSEWASLPESAIVHAEEVEEVYIRGSKKYQINNEKLLTNYDTTIIFQE